LLSVALGILVIVTKDRVIEWQDRHYGGLPQWYLAGLRVVAVVVGAVMVVQGVSWVLSSS
jgi:hypothetical protein